jgi:hypothetical protein
MSKKTNRGWEKNWTGWFLIYANDANLLGEKVCGAYHKKEIWMALRW